MYKPVIPTGGLAGWQFLQSTYERQLKSFSNSADVRLESAYLQDKLSKPVTLEAFLSDRRLLQTAMTAFDLGDEAWKRGFVRKVLTEAADPKSTFLARLNNTQYSRFAETFRPVNGQIRLTGEAVKSIAGRFEAAAFETAVGETDNVMRMALNYRTDIAQIARAGSSDETIAFKILGNVPIRTVLERAVQLPEDVRKLPIERQAELLRERLESRFQIKTLSDLGSAGKTDQVIRRYLAIESLNGQSENARLSLLQGGLGSTASRNLFLSRSS